MKPRTYLVALFFSTVFCVAVGLEVKRFVNELNTDSNREFRWTSGSLGFSFSAAHGGNWNDYVLQFNGRQFLRLTTDGSRAIASDTAGNSTPLEHHAGLRSIVADETTPVARIAYTANEIGTTLSPQAVRLASIIRPCRTDPIHKKGLEGLALASLSQ